jgi:hypothetical protein
VAQSSLALLTASFRAGPERTRAAASYGTTAGIGASLSLVNVSIAVVMIAAALRYLPVIRPGLRPVRVRRRGHLDPA